MQFVITVKKFCLLGSFFLQATPLCLEFFFNSEMGPLNLGECDLTNKLTKICQTSKRMKLPRFPVFLGFG